MTEILFIGTLIMLALNLWWILDSGARLSRAEAKIAALIACQVSTTQLLGILSKELTKDDIIELGLQDILKENESIN